MTAAPDPVVLMIEDPAWRAHRGLQAQVRRAALAAAARAKLRGGFTILLTGDGRLQQLNRDFRGKDRPTNVLSFPADAAGYHGDIAIAHGVAKAEAAAGRKSLTAHACHLAVHGVLHLAGYDHVRARDAKVMENLETGILADMGIADPYRDGRP